MARKRAPDCRHKQPQTLPFVNVTLCLHGPCGPYPATIEEASPGNKRTRQVLEIRFWQESRPWFLSFFSPYKTATDAHHLRVVSMERRGKSALPAHRRRRRFPVTSGRSRISVWGHARKRLQRVLTAHGRLATVLRSVVLCSALERVHRGAYLLSLRSCFRTHEETLRALVGYD
jgi:hypothetical protein